MGDLGPVPEGPGGADPVQAVRGDDGAGLAVGGLPGVDLLVSSFLLKIS